MIFSILYVIEIEVCQMSIYGNYGTSIKEAKDINEALGLCGLDYNVYKKEMFFNIDTKNDIGNVVEVKVPIGTYNVIVGERNGIYNTLGIVSKDYKPLSNKEVFGFSDKIGNIKYVSGGITTNGINYIVMSLEDNKLDINGHSFVPHIVLQNSFNSYNVNGRTGATITYVNNDVAFSLGDNMFNLGFRRKSRTMGDIPKETMPIEKLKTLDKEFTENIKALMNKKISHIDLSNILDHLYPSKDDMTPSALVRNEERKMKYVEEYNKGEETYGKTAFNAFRTYFHFLNNDKPRKGCDKNFQTLLYPHNDTLKYFMGV